MAYFVYILHCADGTLYTGWTTDIEARAHAHNSGKGAKYTRARRPVEVLYTETAADRSAAQRRELEIKRLTRAKKLDLCRQKGPADKPNAGAKRENDSKNY